MHELNVYGVFVSPLLPCALVSLFIAMGLQRLLQMTGLYRVVWHRPLFDFAMFVILLGGMTALARSLI
jgi:hypothetical protein